ncbi:hypothetical protein EMIT0P260_30333 [Pseudomonas sp. IT-P260]
MDSGFRARGRNPNRQALIVLRRYTTWVAYARPLKRGWMLALIYYKKKKSEWQRYEQLAQCVDQPTLVAHFDCGRGHVVDLGCVDAQADPR